MFEGSHLLILLFHHHPSAQGKEMHSYYRAGAGHNSRTPSLAYC